MRRSEFDRAVRDEFGSRGAYLVDDLVLAGAGDRTAAQALAAGSRRETSGSRCAQRWMFRRRGGTESGGSNRVDDVGVSSKIRSIHA